MSLLFWALSKSKKTSMIYDGQLNFLVLWGCWTHYSPLTLAPRKKFNLEYNFRYFKAPKVLVCEKFGSSNFIGL